MRTSPNIQYLALSDFALASVPDAALRKDRLYTLRRLQNYFVDYEMGKLVVRKGYTRWNEKALPAPGTQIYIFQASNTERVLVISDNKWYVVHQTTPDPQLIIDETATSPRPILTIEQRCLLCTDTNAYWTDMDQLTGPDVFKLGIEKPQDAPSIENIGVTGSYDNLQGQSLSPANLPVTVILNKTSNRKLSTQFPVTVPLTVGAVSIRLARPVQGIWFGNIRVKICKDDGGKSMMTAGHVPVLADDNAISEWVPTSEVMYVQPRFVVFSFNKKFDLPAGTYWVVLEGDDQYYNNYYVDPGWVNSFFVAIDYTLTIKYGASEIYDYSTAIWSHCLVLSNHVEFAFYFSGLDTLRYYDYVYTHYNSTYGIESRPSGYSRIKTSSLAPGIHIYTYSRPTDPQVDKIRIYRRELASGVDLEIL